ncbi:hypothetical protein ASPFODRAFT_279340 [Aspergillus luchuensis CBS 106.47]|uniref:Uncharacterized protein n=1 Tax=Aspergillus luchuensis (strain CBS 106.47) TaxID=1137211 RepID=A0A1M3U1K2_ASPLC|nr:hypothetical protein ASPFODRAFT_279340 [Aspergillus luchuensis CBS 106.47]
MLSSCLTPVDHALALIFLLLLLPSIALASSHRTLVRYSLTHYQVSDTGYLVSLAGWPARLTDRPTDRSRWFDFISSLTVASLPHTRGLFKDADEYRRLDKPVPVGIKAIRSIRVSFCWLRSTP